MSRYDVTAKWCTVEQVAEVCEATSEVAKIEEAIWLASETLYHFTGDQWGGVATDTVRPCTTDCASPGIWTPLGLYSGENPPPRRSCGCGWLAEWHFPSRNVVDITQVKIDGDVLVEGTDYALHDADADPKIVRLGRVWWPACQRLDLADTEEGTWSITYTWGQAPPFGGESSAITLASQLLWAKVPAAARDGRCKLPKRATSIVRQGVTMALIDPLDLFEQGKVGIAEVDLWIGSINYARTNRSAQVIDPMRARSVRRIS